MKRLKKNQSEGDADDDPPQLPDPDGRTRDPERKSGLSAMQSMGALLACLILLSVLFSVSVVLRDPPSDGVPPEDRVVQVEFQRDSDSATSQSPPNQPDKFLGGLLAAGFDDKSCLSRYGSALFRKESTHKPSTYLISRLRNYEALHKRCGPNTDPYKKTLEKLKSGNLNLNSIDAIDESDCSYIVWISFSGLGNRILTLASTFLYALLTNRVLLVDPGVDMTDLFCEPFPESSWFLPPDFPLKDRFSEFDQSSQHCYGNMLKNSSLAKPVPPVFMYLHLVHDYNDHDKLFFCDENQAFLNKIPWLVVKTDNYFTPSLFLIPSFEEQLHRMFPQKDTLFHFLGRYLLHPTNPVWGLVSRYYRTYLDGADEKIGIQIRVFDTGVGPFQHVLDQILACAIKEKILPEVEKKDKDPSIPETMNRTTKAVLMTSLNSGYYEKVRDLYWENPTLSGEVVRVFQPSHEEFQQTEKQMHNIKAWSEMYLLSLTDVLVTSAWSTFGYVAQGLGGLKPWIMYKPDNRTVPDPPCRQAMSMEPCFHAPPFYDCKAKRGVDTGEIVPHVRHCEDMSWGLKLVDRSEW